MKGRETDRCSDRLSEEAFYELLGENEGTFEFADQRPPMLLKPRKSHPSLSFGSDDPHVLQAIMAKGHFLERSKYLADRYREIELEFCSRNLPEEMRKRGQTPAQTSGND